jgi:hypothetical protein
MIVHASFFDSGARTELSRTPTKQSNFEAREAESGNIGGPAYTRWHAMQIRGLMRTYGAKPIDPGTEPERRAMLLHVLSPFYRSQPRRCRPPPWLACLACCLVVLFNLASVGDLRAAAFSG